MGERRQTLECGRARYLPSLIALLSLFVQPPSHLQSVLHRSPVRWHLQLPLQATTQPQWRSSEHAWLTSARSVQNGTHWLVLVFHSQPQSLGFGISGILESDCFQIKAAAKRARLACWNKACWVGGIESSDFRLCVNITFIASFSNSASQFLLCRSTVRRSRRRICSESSMRLVGSWINATKVLVTLG